MTAYKSDLLFGSLTGKGRVLVVDDEPDIRRVVRIMLEKAGYDVLEAPDGQAAIEVINTGENRLMVDALLCDMRMPKINAFVTIAYFRVQFPHVLVVVITGFPDNEMPVSSMRHGLLDYLVKPVDGERLKAVVAGAMALREFAWR